MASLGEQAYEQIRRRIVTLELAPGEPVREDELQRNLGIGRTPIREAIQRLAREQFVTVIPRRGMLVAGIDVTELPLLYETRAVLEPYAARLAAARGSDRDWDHMAETIDQVARPGASVADLLAIDHDCHRLLWAAAGNRFLTDTLDTLYAQSDRVWHMFLQGVADMDHAVNEHRAILDALRRRDGDTAAVLAEQHVRGFDAQIRALLDAPTANE